MCICWADTLLSFGLTWLTVSVELCLWWLIWFVCRAVTLFLLLSPPPTVILCAPVLLLTQVEKWQSPSHEVKCILTFWFHCSRQPNIIWSHLLSTLIRSDRSTFGSLSVLSVSFFGIYFIADIGERHMQPDSNSIYYSWMG